jgi:hypothetical protein
MKIGGVDMEKLFMVVLAVLVMLGAMAIFFSSVSPSDLERLFLYLADLFAMDTAPNFQ